ncbi:MULTISPECIES: phospholipase D-like domain-containing protein [Burkholderiaceae]|uniref:phospholipase D-like domain-containing protein n=2 Tax=Burkholderiaceae TaxID=119060 RepID=UPI0009688460|nr:MULTISPECIES: phospholipase D-like domain-containing protein [Burkholderiaceae]SIT66236.1 PLD-like domain-containing protein [Burkholderia sp. b13]
MDRQSFVVGFSRTGMRKDVLVGQHIRLKSPPMKVLIHCLVALACATTLTEAAPLRIQNATVDTYFSPDGGAGAAAAALIDGAKRRVWLAGYAFTSPDIAKALRNARVRGVQVRVVLDKSNETGKYSGATYLANAGIDVRIDSRYPIMHHKFIVVDDVVAFGSMNFTRAGDRKNAENFNVFRGAPALASAYAAEFDRLYAESAPYRR